MKILRPEYENVARPENTAAFYRKLRGEVEFTVGDAELSFQEFSGVFERNANWEGGVGIMFPNVIFETRKRSKAHAGSKGSARVPELKAKLVFAGYSEIRHGKKTNYGMRCRACPSTKTPNVSASWQCLLVATAF